MIDWTKHLLADPAPALGWKKLLKPSKTATDFLAAHADLAISREALQHGNPGSYVPIVADQGNPVSLRGSFYFLDELLARTPGASTGLDVIGSGQQFGTRLENKIASGLRTMVASHRLSLEVASKGSHTASASFQLTEYWPFASPPTNTEGPDVEELYRRLGRGHLIQPDIVVWRSVVKPFVRVAGQSALIETHSVKQLIACISGKGTIRSDRSQSSRYEGSTISRWRRARPPHFVVVTAEPEPARLGSLAWGLGEIDCVYHVNLPALYTALTRVEADAAGKGTKKKESPSSELRALIDNARIRDLSMLFGDLFGEMLP